MIAASGDRPQLFAAIFDRHFDAVHGYLARRIGAGGADDLASATFTVAFERRHTFHADAGSARPWLFGIATNLLRNQWRADRRSHALVAELTPRVAAGGTAPDRAAAEVAELLAALDADQRDVLILHAWEGFSYREIAAALGVPVGTVRSRLARGRAALRSVLAGDAAVGIDAQEANE